MNCEKCGAYIPFGTTSCEFCNEPAAQQPSVSQQNFATSQSFSAQRQPAMALGQSENVLSGIVGALIGAAIGGGSIVLLGQLGYIAAISGFILAVCTLKGYEMLGRQLSVKGILICLLLIIATPYFANRLDWALSVKDVFSEYGVTLGDAFSSIPELLEAEIIDKSVYIRNLVLLYVFAALGAGNIVRDLFK